METCVIFLLNILAAIVVDIITYFFLVSAVRFAKVKNKLAIVIEGIGNISKFLCKLSSSYFNFCNIRTKIFERNIKYKQLSIQTFSAASVMFTSGSSVSSSSSSKFIISPS